MQKIKYLIGFAAVLFLVCTLYAFFSFKSDYEAKIAKHIRVADSLRQQSLRLDKQLYQRDSVLNQYMKSLDQALTALHDKSVKNRVSIASNLSKLDSIQLAYCNEMQKIGVNILECQ
jgi:nitrate/nitrite-specific signal transduction histidine kinase